MRASCLVASLVPAIAGACAPGATSAAPRACNGHVELCDRALDDVVFAGAHNAMSSRDDGFSIPNQELALPGQLRLGVRAFLLDTHPPEDGAGVLLCHGPCSIGELPLVEELGRLKRFLDASPDTVVQLLVEDRASIADTRAAFAEAELLDELFVHRADDAWPTLGAMIDDRTRIFVTAESGVVDDAEPWFHPMFTLVQDTPFSFTSIDELRAEGSCDLNRGAAGNPLFLVNHWLGDPFPDDDLAVAANAIDVLDERVHRCADRRGRLPNVVAVDYVDAGALFTVVDALNGL
jgi:hypothetical protein